MKVRFWGVRGAFAMSGPDYLRYGGNTSAIEVVADSGQRVLVDLGTGATEFAKEAMAGDFGEGKGELPILLTHTHLDHIQGLPFFTPFFIKGNRIRILGAEPMGPLSLEDVLQNQLNPHYSPLYGLENLAAGVNVISITPGSSLPVEGFEVSAIAAPHGSMWVLAFRLSADDKSIVLLTDVEYPTGEPTPEAVALAHGADLLVHDAMFSDGEYDARRGWGHSATKHAIALAERAEVGQLALFHHNPDANDAAIDRIVDAARKATEIPLLAAAEGPYLRI